MRKKIVASYLALVVGFFWAGASAYGRGADTIVEVPTTHNSALVEVPTTATVQQSPEPTENLTVGREYKNVESEKNVVEEQEKVSLWNFYTDALYDSKYIFRGTNLTPGSKGIGEVDAQVSRAGFTFGITAIHQFGTARADSWSIGESGGGGATKLTSLFTDFYTRLPTTIQKRFNEVDIYLSYKVTLGPIDLTIGDIGFFIDRDASTFEADVAPPGFHWLTPPTTGRVRMVGPNPTVEDEQFDRAYIRLSTTKLCKFITPQITYYQTLLSQGDQPTQGGLIRYAPDVNGRRPFNPRPFNERNPEDFGGYLEGKVNGKFQVTHWMDIDPYALVSVSFRDRVEPGGSQGRNQYGAHPLTGWNHFQTGVKVPVRVMHFASSGVNVYLSPFGDYSYHIANPTPGTDRDELSGGGAIEVTF